MTTGSAARAAATRDDGAQPRVVVGVDGSPGARAALRAAFLEAVRRGASLEVVAAYPEVLVWTGGIPLDVPDVDAVRRDTRDRALTFLDEVRTELLAEEAAGVAELPVQLAVTGGPAAVVLGSQAEGAALLVVGSRGRGALRSALLGSVALHCVAHAPCPVSVVHGHPEVRDDRHRKVVAGFDGSDASVGALREALAEGVRLGADVDVVVAHSLADHWADMYAAVPDVEELRTRARDRARAVADQLLAEMAAAAQAVPRVQVVLVEGSPTGALLEAAEDAAVLVVGSRGHGLIRGLLLGSVALHCAVHAPCPVTVVHPQDTTAPAPSADRPAMARG
jgi:nucleotide-binding universal stress UspA family protein